MQPTHPTHPFHLQLLFVTNAIIVAAGSSVVANTTTTPNGSAALPAVTLAGPGLTCVSTMC